MPTAEGLQLFELIDVFILAPIQFRAGLNRKQQHREEDDSLVRPHVEALDDDHLLGHALA